MKVLKIKMIKIRTKYSTEYFFFIIILYVVEESEKLFTFCMVSILRKTFRTEWLRKFLFNFNLTGV